MNADMRIPATPIPHNTGAMLTALLSLVCIMADKSEDLSLPNAIITRLVKETVSSPKQACAYPLPFCALEFRIPYFLEAASLD